MKNFLWKFEDLQTKISNYSKTTLLIHLYNLRKLARSGLLVSVRITAQLLRQLMAVFFGFGLELMPNTTNYFPNIFERNGVNTLLA